MRIYYSKPPASGIDIFMFYFAGYRYKLIMKVGLFFIYLYMLSEKCLTLTFSILLTTTLSIPFRRTGFNIAY